VIRKRLNLPADVLRADGLCQPHLRLLPRINHKGCHTEGCGTEASEQQHYRCGDSPRKAFERTAGPLTRLRYGLIKKVD
jgi:hypothetical protein